jgi:glycosyltransferase involved in cell wall biosynthesis
LHRVHHVVDVEGFARGAEARGSLPVLEQRRQLGLRGFTFCYVGRIWEQKGIGTLLDAASLLRSWGIEFSLLLVGDGVDANRYRCLARVHALNEVKFLAFVQQTELPSVLALANAFVFPTRGDPYGLVVDEAMASGLPVIATYNAGEIHSRVVPGRTGDLVPVDDAASLAAAMARLARNPRLALAMGSAGQSRIRRRTYAGWADEIERMVEREVRGGKRGP